MYQLIPSTNYKKSLKKTLKKNPSLASDIAYSLLLLQKDPKNPKLKTHKLKGELSDSWSSTVQYNLRIVFKFKEYEKNKAILLGDIGTHDEVY